MEEKKGVAKQTSQKSSRVARLAAYSVDGLILFLLQIVLQIGLSVAKAEGISTLISLVVNFGYFWFFTVKYGATLGKRFFGLRVVTVDGSESIDPVKGFLREVVGRFISGIVLSLGYLWILWDKERQGWHDKIAGTYVLQVVPLTGGKKVLAYIIAFILPVLGVIAIALAVLLVAINPYSQIQKAQEAQEDILRQQQELQQEYQQEFQNFQDLQGLPE